MEPNWVSRSKIPLNTRAILKPCLINQQEMVINSANWAIESKFIKYNFREDKYESWEMSRSKYDIGAIEFNIRVNDCIYYQASHGPLIVYNMKTTKWNKYPISTDKQKKKYHFWDSTYCKVNNFIHIIGDRENNEHGVWDLNKNEYKSLDSINKPKKAIILGGLIYIKKRQKLLLFGGCWEDDHWSSTQATDDILFYDIKQNKWAMASIKLPIKMSSFGYVKTNDDKYLIIFGGIDECNYFLDNIYILDLINMKINECKVKCPVRGEFYAYIQFDNIENNLIVNGYIRNCWKLKEFKSMINLPDVIIKLIQSYMHYNEIVHLFEQNEGEHYKINIDLILDKL